MKKLKRLLFICSIVRVSISFGSSTTIDSINKNAYGANIGWIDAVADGANGMMVGQAFCSGYIYSANCGWIHLGDGSPANGYAYANNSASDYGINHDGLGHLTGYAYGANIGWINFEQTYGKPSVNLSTGQLSGYIWGANVGWISLNTSKGYVQTTSLDPGPDNDNDGIADAWEYENATKLTAFTANSDADKDGALDIEEYLAGTDPLDANDYLMITDLQIGETQNIITWNAKKRREYTLQETSALTNGWNDLSTAIPESEPDMKVMHEGLTNDVLFYRVKVAFPLSNE